MSPQPVDGVNKEVELYVRSLAPAAAHEHQEGIIEHLEALEARGHIAGFDVHVWGKRVDTSSAAARTEAGQFVRERIQRFRTWAEENGRSTDSFFEEDRVRSAITGEEYSAVVLPTATLAEYVDGALEFVAPCSDGDSVVGVDDRLDELIDGEPSSAAPRLAQGGSP